MSDILLELDGVTSGYMGDIDVLRDVSLNFHLIVSNYFPIAVTIRTLRLSGTSFQRSACGNFTLRIAACSECSREL